MKIILATTVLSTVVSACLIIGLSMLYAAGGLAAAQTTRFIPFVGDQVSDQIQGWVLGAPTQHIIDDSPLPIGGEPITPAQQISGTLDERVECQRPLGLPVDGPIRQYFRPPENPAHSGVDLSVVTGTRVRATMCGHVTYAGWWEFPDGSPGYGYLVVVSNGIYATYYAHNSELLVGVGDAVEAGQVLALSGSTGWSTGPHVHYEVRVDGVPVDPLGYV